jgi:L-alanine-DL-glutamate epimerase-like enolase superfamily enzyme
MTPVTRRAFLRSSAIAPLALPLFAVPKPTNITIEEVRTSTEDFTYRAPLKFGGVVVDRVTLLNVHCRVRTAAGKSAEGFGSMPLGNIWSFPSKTMPYPKTLAAMKALAARIEPIVAGYREPGHPLDINHALEATWLTAAEAVSRELSLDAPIPKLCTLVTASPFEAAIHDAYGKVHNRSAYATYSREFLNYDLAHYLGPEFKGEYLDRYVTRQPKPWMPLYHLIGAVDPLEDSDIATRLNDGLPETLPEWIRADGLTHLKIKLNGDNLNWDSQRVLRIERVAAAPQAARKVSDWVYSLDFNEKCPNVEYLIEFLRKVKEASPQAYARIQYVEQPTARNLKAHRSNVMHQASRLKPVVIDESLTDQEALMMARDMGYTGAALKACKGQSQAVLMAAVAQKYKMFLCVQDLTCPGASLIHSAGLAAHVPTVAAIESNARQYVPAANRDWEARFPGIFRITDGRMRTGAITGNGLGAV